jgi:predicted dehydrogenase
MARGHLRSYIEIKKAEPDLIDIVAMCDPVGELAEGFAVQAEPVQGTKPQVHTNVEGLLAAGDLDAVDICCPHGLHHVNAIACLSAGANVMIEKPFGVTIRASKAIIAAAERAGRIAATAENVRRGLSQRTSHWLLNETKLLGTPRLFFAQHASWREPNEPRNWVWRADSLMGGGGMVMDSGAHYCDTLRYLFGDLESAYARVEQIEDRPMQKGDVSVFDDREDTWIATLNFASGLTGVWSWTQSAPGHDWTRVVYYGSEGALIDHRDVFHGPFSNAEVQLKDGTHFAMTDLQEQYLDHLGAEGRARLFPHGWTDGVQLECYDFVKAAASGGKVEVDGIAGMKAKAIAETIYESAAAGTLVRYADVLSGAVDAYQRPIDQHWGLA